MNANQLDLARLLHADGVVSRREHPELAETCKWLARQGRLCRVLPGVYASPDAVHDLPVRVQALTAWCPDAVITGRAAAKLLFWPTVDASVIEFTAPIRRLPTAGYVATRRRIPPDLVVERAGIRCTTPALTAVDLAVQTGGDSVDAALRSRRTTLAALHEALAQTRGRTTNPERLSILLDSRDEPWSRAERDAHRLFRAEGLRPFAANYPVQVRGLLYYVDIAFVAARLAIEIDGRAHHGADAFEADRWRQNDLVLEGWRVLRFTWDMISRTPQLVVAAVRQALAGR